MFGYDLPRLHAALNDLPVALLLVSVLFDLLGALNQRDSLKAAGLWTLVIGTLGTIAAVATGLLAEGVVEHSDEGHAVMETHETLARIVLVLFGVLCVWRLYRRGVWSAKEQPIALTAGVIGVALMVYTAKLGGTLVFDHAIGIKTSRLETVAEERGGDHRHQSGEPNQPAPSGEAASPDTMKAAADSHTHPGGETHKR